MSSVGPLKYGPRPIFRVFWPVAILLYRLPKYSRVALSWAHSRNFYWFFVNKVHSLSSFTTSPSGIAVSRTISVLVPITGFSYYSCCIFGKRYGQQLSNEKYRVNKACHLPVRLVCARLTKRNSIHHRNGPSAVTTQLVLRPDPLRP